jgi:hypothetical protein
MLSVHLEYPPVNFIAVMVPSGAISTFNATVAFIQLLNKFPSHPPVEATVFVIKLVLDSPLKLLEN